MHLSDRLAAFSLTLLLLLLPIGLMLGVNNALYDLIFLAHLTILLIFIFCEIKTFLSKKLFINVIVLLFFLLFLLCLGLHPIIAKDALTHHVAVPNLWILDNQIKSYAWHEWSHYPMLFQCGFVPFLKHNLEFLIAPYQSLFLMAATFVVANTSLHFISKQAAFFSSILIAASPTAIRLTTEVMVDLGLLFLVALASRHFISAICHSRSNCYSIFYLGLFLGLAACSKYSALPYLVSSLAILLFFIPFKDLLKVSLITLLVGSPWYVKNFIETGNPFFPLYGALFGTALDSSYSLPNLKPLQYRVSIYGEDWLSLLLTPFKMIFFAQDNSPRLYDGGAFPLIFLSFLAPLLIFIKRDKQNLKIVLALSLLCLVVYAISLLSSSWRLRYLIPLFPALAFLTAYSLDKLFKEKRLISYLALSQLLISFVYAYYLFAKYQVLPYLTNKISDEDYLEFFLPEYLALKKIASFKHSSNHGKTYLLFTQNNFYHLPNSLSGGYRSERLLVSWIRRSKDHNDLLNFFKNKKIKYIYLKSSLVNPGLYSVLKEKEIELLENFMRLYSKLLFRDKGYSFYYLGT
jgi:hypothetical protein